MQIKFPKIEFIKNQSYFLVLSAIIISASVFYIATKGLNYGTDFKGGVKLVYKFAQATSEGKVKDILGKLALGDLTVQRFGDVEENTLAIRVEQPESDVVKVAPIITDELVKAYGQENVTLLQEETVGPKVGSELRKKGILAFLASLALVLIYIGFRFDFYYAPGAILALVHDVIVTVGFFAFFQKEFDLTILAAVLTIVGYSLNDTIVIFDRIRENAGNATADDIAEISNRSVNETLSRSIITSLTVLFVVVILFFFGGATLHDFSFAMIVGVISGSYSTIFIATPIYLYIYKNWPRVAAKFGWNER